MKTFNRLSSPERLTIGPRVTTQEGQKQSDFLDDGVDLSLTTILEALPATIGDDQEKLYHELGLTIDAAKRILSASAALGDAVFICG